MSETGPDPSDLDCIEQMPRGELESFAREVASGFKRLLSAVKSLQETPIEEQPPERVRMGAKWTQRRNERLKEKNRELEQENEQLRKELKARKVKKRINRNHWKGRAAVLQSELETAREEIEELKRTLDRVRGEEAEKVRQAKRLARAVASGEVEIDDPESSSNTELYLSLSTWTEQTDEIESLSSKTVKRRFKMGLEAREGNGLDLEETLRRCESPSQYLG